MSTIKKSSGVIPKKSEAVDTKALSFQFLDRRFRGPLMKFFSRRINIAADAEDLVQEVFLRLSKPGRLSSVENCEAYVFRTAANLIRERHRSRTSRGLNLEVELDCEITEDECFVPERILLAKDEIESVIIVLNELPERTRVIFILQRFEGFSHPEIAQRLRISKSAVEKHMSRAIKHLAASFLP